MKRAAFTFAIIAVLLSSFCLASSRHDQDIAKSVMTYLSNHKEYRSVGFAVEDEIVTISGHVPTLSDRLALDDALRRMKYVRNVRNLVVLNPPAVSDEKLGSGLRARFAQTGLELVRWQAHEGRVLLSGSVRNRNEWSRAVDLAWSVEGVREVLCEIKIEEK